jgi:guanine deaminase
MCLGAIYWAGIKKVVYAFDRTEAEKAGFSDKFIYDEIMLEPSSRQVRFLHIPGCSNGTDPFRKWDEYENKIPY